MVKTSPFFKILGCILCISNIPLQASSSRFEQAASAIWYQIKQTAQEDPRFAAIFGVPLAIGAVAGASKICGIPSTMLLGTLATAIAYYHYKQTMIKPVPETEDIVAHIGHIYITDAISRDSQYQRKFQQALEECSKDPKIKGIILHIDARGCPIGLAQALYLEIQEVGKQKPIVALIEKECLGEIYLIAAATQCIIANEHSKILSGIAQIVTAPTIPEADLHVYYTGTDTIYTQQPLAAASKKLLAQHLAASDKAMCATIEKSRPALMNADTSKEAIWSGKLFTGQEAYAYKLIDRIGSLTVALEEVARLLTSKGGSYTKFERYDCYVPGQEQA